MPTKVNYAALPWATYCDPELGQVGLTEADYQAAADAAYLATVAGLTAQGFEVVDNAALVEKLKSKNLVKPNGAEYSFAEGNRQSSKAAARIPSALLQLSAVPSSLLLPPSSR